MDYIGIYNRLIERGRSRRIYNISYYTEKHHIIPKCMGGSNDKTNLVRLTAEEHYVAHQLLVKIYPEHRGLVYACYMMTVKSKTHSHTRINNKIYGWIRRRLYEKPNYNKVKTIKKMGRPKVSFNIEKALELRMQGHSWSKVAKEVESSIGSVRRSVVPLLSKER